MCGVVDYDVCCVYIGYGVCGVDVVVDATRVVVVDV